MGAGAGAAMGSETGDPRAMDPNAATWGGVKAWHEDTDQQESPHASSYWWQPAQVGQI